MGHVSAQLQSEGGTKGRIESEREGGRERDSEKKEERQEIDIARIY